MTLPSPQGGIPTKITKYSERNREENERGKKMPTKYFILAIAESFLSHLELFQKVFLPEASTPLQLFEPPILLFEPPVL